MLNLQNVQLGAIELGLSQYDDEGHLHNARAKCRRPEVAMKISFFLRLNGDKRWLRYVVSIHPSLQDRIRVGAPSMSVLVKRGRSRLCEREHDLALNVPTGSSLVRRSCIR